MDTRKAAALIPAAGTSTRMGEFKPLLPLGGKTVIEQAIGRFQAAGVERICVVVGHRAVDLIPVIEKAGAGWVENQDVSRGMFSSIQVGLGALPEESGAFFVLPADIPLVRAGTLSALKEAGAAGLENIYYPTFEAQRGHPPLIATALREQIAAYSGDGGLRGFLQKTKTGTSEVPVADEGILLDLDTPEDYRRVCARAEKLDIPTAGECLALLTIRFGDGAAVIDHCRAVARIALALAAGLNRAGCPMDADLAHAAGLLHDVAKGTPDHAEAGACLLASLGFDRVGDVVRGHMDLVAPGNGPVEVKEVVYLADKLVQGDRLVAMETRFEDKLKCYGDDPLKRSAIARRQEQALAVKKRIERWLGQPLESFLPPTGR